MHKLDAGRWLEMQKMRRQERLEAQDEVDKSRANLLTYNCFANVTGNLIGGSFLTGLLLYLNASTLQLGLVNIITYACNLLQLFAPMILEKFSHRKKMLITALVIIRISNIVCISLATLLPVQEQAKVYVILCFIAICNIANSIWSPGATVWHIQSVPENKRARYFSIQQRLANVCIYVALLLASAFTDYMKGTDQELGGYLWLRAIAVLFCIGELFFVGRVKEFPYEKGAPVKLHSVFVEPFRHKRYMLSILLLFLWNLLANTVGSYFTVYLLEDVQVKYTFMNIINAMYVPVVLIFMPVWSRMARKHSWFNLSWKALFGYGLFIGSYMLITKERTWIYPVLALGANIFAVGINLSFANVPYYHIPKENQTLYMSFYAALANLAALMGTTYATKFATTFENCIFYVFGMPLETPQLMQMMTGCMILITGAVALWLDQHEKKKYGIITGT